MLKYSAEVIPDNFVQMQLSATHRCFVSQQRDLEKILKLDKPLTPELAIELYGTNDATFGGHYYFGSQYGFTPNGKPCEYDPAVSSGVCGQDENGDAYIPLYGEDEDGEEELVGGKAYKVVETQKV